MSVMQIFPHFLSGDQCSPSQCSSVPEKKYTMLLFFLHRTVLKRRKKHQKMHQKMHQLDPSTVKKDRKKAFGMHPETHQKYNNHSPERIKNVLNMRMRKRIGTGSGGCFCGVNGHYIMLSELQVGMLIAAM